MMRKLLFIALISCSTISFGQQNDWDKRATFLGQKRARAVAFAIGDYGYVGTGIDTAEMTHNDLWRFDPSTNSWSQMADMYDSNLVMTGSVRRNAVAVTVGNLGYVGLGMDSAQASFGTELNDWWAYDAVSNTWELKASYPGGYDWTNNYWGAGVYFATAFEAGGKAYVCGGKMGPDTYAADLWEYDPQLDSWTRKADFPGLDRYQLSSFSVDGKGYVGMGVDHDLFRKDWWQYNPQTDSWAQVSNLPGVERGAASTFVIGQRGFVVFGSDGGYKDELWEYNPFTDSWQIRANFPGGERKNAIAFAIGDSAYAGTGQGASGKRRNFYVYYPLFPVGMSENYKEFKIYPNPASYELNVSSLNGLNVNRVEIYNTKGQFILSSQESKIDIGHLESGSYILNIFDENQKHITSEQIIISR